jgi:anti-sigma factor RsiW
MTEHPSEILPWYVNGSLNDAERELVKTHLATCAACQEEVVALESLQRNVKCMDSDAQSPGELGLARLKRRLRSETDTAETQSPRRWLRPTLAAACVMIVLQAGLIWNMNHESRQDMQLLSGPVAADIQVRFASHASEEQIRLLLQSIHGQIVDGPSALAIYHIRIESEKDRKQSVNLAIQTLRKRSAVVDFVAQENE